MGWSWASVGSGRQADSEDGRQHTSTARTIWAGPEAEADTMGFTRKMLSLSTVGLAEGTA